MGAVSDNADGRFDYGPALRARKAAVAAGRALVAAHPGDARLDRLSILVHEVAERWAKMPKPLGDHEGQLAMVVQAERDAAMELARVEHLFAPAAEQIAEEAPPI